VGVDHLEAYLPDRLVGLLAEDPLVVVPEDLPVVVPAALQE